MIDGIDIGCDARHDAARCASSKKPERFAQGRVSAPVEITVQKDRMTRKNAWLSERLYQSIKRRVKRSLSHMEQDVEDAFHEALISVMRVVESGDQPVVPEKIEAYLVQATKRKLIDAFRKKTTTSNSHESYGADPTATSKREDEDPEAVAISVQRYAHFQLLLDCLRGKLEATANEPMTETFHAVQRELAEQLSDQHWIVLRARGINGCGFKACAAMIQASTATAHNRWNEAIGIIRSALMRHGVDPEGGS